MLYRNETSMKQKKDNKTDLLICFFNTIYLEDITNTSKTKIFLYRIFNVCVMIIYIDYLLLCALGDLLNHWKLSISYILVVTTSVVTWLVLGRKRAQLRALLNFTFAKSNKTFQKSNLIFCVICSISFLYIVLNLIASEDKHLTRLYTFYTYNHFITEKRLRLTILFIKMFFIQLLFPTFPNIVTLVFCKSCNHSCDLLRDLTQKIEKCSPRNFSRATQLEFVRCKTRVMSVINEVQEVFSTTLLLLCIASSFTGFLAVGTFVHYDFNKVDVWKIADSICVVSISVVPLTAVIWSAGRVPIEIKQLRDAFCKKIECRVLLGLESEDLKLERWLYDIPEFVLIGGDVLHFRRSMILTVYGTILTYTFLLMNNG